MNEDIVFDLEKYKAVIHYIIDKCSLKDNVERTVLQKLLYFSDFDHYEIFERPITGEKYVKKPRGPVPTHFNDTSMKLEREGKISICKEKSENDLKFRYSSLTPPVTDSLSQNELDLIDGVVDKLSDFHSSEISEYSHGDFPWRLAGDNAELNYEAVFYREPQYSVRIYR
jgi:uncharacterized phage-associated protein